MDARAMRLRLQKLWRSYTTVSMPRVALDRWVFCALFVLVWPAGAEEWTRFRGPNGSGVSNDTGFPTEFGKEKNLLWRTPVRPGKSSPILTPRHIFLTGF